MFAIWYLGSEKGWPSFQALINAVWNGNFGVINICMAKKLWLVIMKLVLRFSAFDMLFYCKLILLYISALLVCQSVTSTLPRVNDSFVTWFSTQMTGNHNIDVACCNGLRTFTLNLIGFCTFWVRASLMRQYTHLAH